MCQAIPRPVIQVVEGRAEVLMDGRPTWVVTTGLPDLVPGEYIVVYAGAAIERIPEEDALEMLRFIDEMNALFEGDEPVLPLERYL